MTPAEVLALPMQTNDAEVETIRDYLVTLLSTVWVEQEGFDGKRPFGNSGWSYDLVDTLVGAGAVHGPDPVGDAYYLIREAIESLRAVTTPTTDLYFEAHVTIDPITTERMHPSEVDEAVQRLRFVAQRHGFRVAELLMRKGQPRSTIDDFLTGRGTDYDDVCYRMHDLVDDLRNTGYTVRRYKLENTLVDVRLVTE